MTSHQKVFFHHRYSDCSLKKVFVAINTAGICPKVSLKIPCGVILTNIKTSKISVGFTYRLLLKYSQAEQQMEASPWTALGFDPLRHSYRTLPIKAASIWTPGSKVPHCFVMKRSILFSSPVSCCNVAADRCRLYYHIIYFSFVSSLVNR